MRKGILSAFAALLLFASPLTVTSIWAEDNPLDHTIVVEPTQPGDVAILPEKDLSIVPKDGLGDISIQLTDTEDGLPKEDVQFGLAQIADIQAGKYIMNDPYEQAGIEINDLQTANDLYEASMTLKDYVEEPDAVRYTNKLGQTSFTNLEVGVYLVYPMDVNEYEVIEPFIVALPTWDENDQVMLYEVDVLPKHSHLPVIEIQKKDSVTGQNITNNAFEFTSYSDENCVNSLQRVSGDINEGIAHFTVTYGTTYIKESSAPQGYLLSDEVIEVEFSEDGLFINGQKAQPVDDYIYQVDYLNEESPGINTGETNSMGLYLILIGAIGFIIIVISKHRKT